MSRETWQPQPEGGEPRRRVFGRWRQADASLAELLTTEPPADATAVPVVVRFGWGGTFVFGAFFVGAAIVLGVTFWYVGDWRFTAGFALAIVVAVLSSQIPDWNFRYNSVTLSGEGFRAGRHWRDDVVIPWSSVRSIVASPHLNTIRVASETTRVNLTLKRRKADVKITFATALRAYTREYGVDIQEWPKNDLRLRQATSTSLQVAAAIVFGATLFFFGPGGTLGIRCSANSAYMRKTFGTPDRAGCVVLRVSAGAAKAGVRRGDLMIEMNGHPVTSGQQFQALFDNTGGNPWTFKMIRTGEPQPLEFKVRGARGRNFAEDEDDPFFYYLRGRWDASDNPESAMRDYTRAIELEPQFDLAYLYRADLLAEDGRIEEARQDYERALQRSPSLGEAHAFYANFLFLHGDWFVGVEEVKQAIQLDACDGAFEDFNVDCAFDYGVLAVFHQRVSSADLRNEAEQAIAFYPVNAFPYYLAACGHAVLKEDAEAVERAREYLRFPGDQRRSTETSRMEALINEGTPC